MQSTHDMIRAASARLQKADAELNATYKKLLAKLDVTGQKKLKAAQLAWIKYRDAESEFDADLMRGGTGAGPIRIESQVRSTQERLKVLQDNLKTYSN
jgi:uncharacterized protein YecT (DUF1311 family)